MFLIRYMLGSTTIEKGSVSGEQYAVQGKFVAHVPGKPLRITYGAFFEKADNEYKLAYICYTDMSTGELRTDCIDPAEGIDRKLAELEKAKRSRATASSRSRDSDSAEAPRQRHCRREYSYGSPGMLGYEDNGQGSRGIPTEVCD